MTFTPDLPVRLWQGALTLAALGVGLLAGIDPIRSALAAAALAVMFIVLSDLTLGLCLFAFLAFLDYYYPNVATLFVLGLAMSWLAAVTAGGQRGREFVATHPGATWLIALLPAWAAMSLLWAEASPPATSAVVKYAVNGALFLIVFTAVKTRRHVVLVLGAFVLSAAFSAAYGLVVPAESTSYDELERVGGAIGDPNALARLLVAGLVLASLLAATGLITSANRLLAASAAVVCAAGLVLTLSRGGLVALAFALVAALVFAGRWRAQVGVLVVAVGLIAGGYYVAIATPEAQERLTTSNGGSGRTDLWRVGWAVVEDRPVLGAGAGNFGVVSRGYLGEAGLLRRSDLIVSTSNVLHNTYLGTLVELGVVGACLLLAILGFSLGCLVRAARTSMRAGDAGMELLARGLFVALVAMLAADFFISEPYNKHLWLLLALCPAVLAVARDRSVPEETGAASTTIAGLPPVAGLP